jgi:hypothetical protein
MNKIQIEISLDDLTFIDNMCLNQGYNYQSLLKEMIKVFKDYESKKGFVKEDDIRKEHEIADGEEAAKAESPRARRKK